MDPPSCGLPFSSDNLNTEPEQAPVGRVFHNETSGLAQTLEPLSATWLRERIDAVLEANPDLCGAGWLGPNSYFAGDRGRFADYRYEIVVDDMYLPWVAACIAFLSKHAPQRPEINRRVDSCELSKRVTSLTGCYVSDGALIIAALILGYEVERNEGSSCHLALEFGRDAQLAPVAVEIQYPGAASTPISSDSTDTSKRSITEPSLANNAVKEQLSPYLSLHSTRAALERWIRIRPSSRRFLGPLLGAFDAARLNDLLPEQRLSFVMHFMSGAFPRRGLR